MFKGPKGFNMNSFVMEGTFVFTPNKDKFEIREDSFIIVVDNKVVGIFDTVPAKYSSLKMINNKGKIIIPGLIDLHLHAPQYKFRATGMDLELLDWLNTYTFPEESKFKDTDYANSVYSKFVEELKKGPTTRACMFATLHKDATLSLMDLLETSGLKSFVGKVNMDRNSPEYLVETTKESLTETRNWIDEATKRQYKNTKCILTPRFTPSCSDELMSGLKEIQESYDVPFQSHLSENEKEIEWVKELEPWAANYGEAYSKFGLMEDSHKTIMAHCVSCPDDEIELLKANGVYVAHSPESNINLSSGIAPVRKYLDKGLKVGLATDTSGGSSLSMFRAIQFSIQVSKLYWRLVDKNSPNLSTSEAFYIATKGGGSFFGKVGSFEEGYEFDAVVIDDSTIPFSTEFSIINRIEKIIYLADSSNIMQKYVNGISIL
jgi:guanine deaminase